MRLGEMSMRFAQRKMATQAIPRVISPTQSSYIVQASYMPTRELFAETSAQAADMSEQDLFAASKMSLALSPKTVLLEGYSRHSPAGSYRDSPKHFHRHIRFCTNSTPKYSTPPSRSPKRHKYYTYRTKPRMLPPTTEIKIYAHRMYNLLNYRFRQTGVSDWDICLIIAQSFLETVSSRPSDAWKPRNKHRRALALEIHDSLNFMGPVGDYCGIKNPRTWGILSDCKEPHHLDYNRHMSGPRNFWKGLAKLAHAD